MIDDFQALRKYDLASDHIPSRKWTSSRLQMQGTFAGLNYVRTHGASKGGDGVRASARNDKSASLAAWCGNLKLYDWIILWG